MHLGNLAYCFRFLENTLMAVKWIAIHVSFLKHVAAWQEQACTWFPNTSRELWTLKENAEYIYYTRTVPSSLLREIALKEKILD